MATQILNINSYLNTVTASSELRIRVTDWRLSSKAVEVERPRMRSKAVEVLVVQEKSAVFGGSGVWKFLTVVVDEGEDICDAAVREVKEETGIDAEFVEVLAFRQSHKAFYQKSDLFFVCMLKQLSSNIQKQDTEIEAAKRIVMFPLVDHLKFEDGQGFRKEKKKICLPY
ncbi:hypothetical protein QQ045_006913 [Rhodiola kirilowii]